MFLILLLFILIALIAGIGAGIKFLWILAIVLGLFWLIGFFAGGARWR